MGNRINVDLRKFETLDKDFNVESITYGISVYDDYGKDYTNLFSSREDLEKELDSLGCTEQVLKVHFPDYAEYWGESYFTGSVLDYFGEDSHEEEESE